MKAKIFILAVLILPITAMGQIFHKNVDISEVKVTPPVFTGVQLVPDEPVSQDNFLGKYLAVNIHQKYTTNNHQKCTTFPALSLMNERSEMKK